MVLDAARVVLYTAGALALLNIYVLFDDVRVHQYPPRDVHRAPRASADSGENISPARDGYGDEALFGSDTAAQRSQQQHSTDEENVAAISMVDQWSDASADSDKSEWYGYGDPDGSERISSDQQPKSDTKAGTRRNDTEADDSSSRSEEEGEGSSLLWVVLQIAFELADEVLPVVFMLVVMAGGGIMNMLAGQRGPQRRR
eukprot:scpid90056/ scgid16635/ 